MKKFFIYMLICLMFLSASCFNNSIILPENISELYNYRWVVVQNMSEPECYTFSDNGKLEILGYSYEKYYKWSFSNDKITIYFKNGSKSYIPEIFDEKGIKYLKLDNKKFKGTKLKS